MSKPACARAFEAEALRDGRLTGGERASYERHIVSCAACTREVTALDALRGALQAEGDELDEVRDRRERVRLLAAFDARLVKPKRSLSRIYQGFAAGLAAAACVAGWFAWQHERAPNAPETAVTVHAEGVAAWSADVRGGEERVTLHDGSLRIHVDHARGGPRLIVAVPDGELEDIGTTFVVTVVAGHTTRVAVEEGRVLARLGALPERSLRAGESWTPDTGNAVIEREAAPTPVPSAAPTASSKLLEVPNTPAAIANPAPADAAADFRAAMAALTRGDNRRAEQMLGAFLQKHRRNPHAEDAAYSRVIALQRCGDAADTKRAAEQYLARFPAGFRRAEVEALAR